MFNRITNKTTKAEILTEISALEQENYLPLENKDLPYHHYGYVQTFRVVSDNLKFSVLKQLIGGILAGIWIGVGYTAACYATYTIDNASARALLLGAIFSGVILLIAFLGGSFLTAHMWFNRAMFKRIERWEIFLKACTFVYLGNILGIMLFVIILFLSNAFGNVDLLKFVYLQMGLKKLYEIGALIKTDSTTFINTSAAFKTLVWVLFSGILCNFLVCLATQGAKSTKGNTVAAMIMYFIILFFFVIAGYQHCVANWYVAWVLICMAIAPATATGIEHFNPHSAWLFLIFNILPAIIGNYLGAFIMGLLMGWFNKDLDNLLVKEARLKFLKLELVRRDKNVINLNKESKLISEDKKIIN